MSKNTFLIVFVLFNSFLCLTLFGQTKSDDSTTSRTKTPQNGEKRCRVFISGKILSNPKPVYPIEAASANLTGKVEVIVEVDDRGNVVGIDNTNGNESLKNVAIEAAKLAKFSPPSCDGVPTKTIAVLTYNFTPPKLLGNYFIPAKLEDFTDVSTSDNYFEAVLFLTENYKIAVGYADGKYHGEMPLTKGDFAYSLRQTLELIDSRAKMSRRDLKEIPIYKSYNPYKLKAIEFNPTQPFADSVKILSDKYGIILADKNELFEGDSLQTQHETIEIWQNVFGEESIPINFRANESKEKIISRGDFAIFLTESLGYLIYKTLP